MRPGYDGSMSAPYHQRGAPPPAAGYGSQTQPLPPPPQGSYGSSARGMPPPPSHSSMGYSSGPMPPPMAPPPPRSMMVPNPMSRGMSDVTMTDRSRVGSMSGSGSGGGSTSSSMGTDSTVKVTIGEGSAPIQMSKEYAMRSVVVRNIPPDADESELHRICATVGSVIKFRLVFDRQSGQAKGIGYCEFADSSLAAMAIRKLDRYQYKNRELIVRRPELASSSKSGMTSKESIEKSATKTAMRSARKTVDEITRAVSKLTAKQKRQILSEMKALILKNEDNARELLVDRPQLAQALVLIQMELGLIEPSDIQALTIPVKATHDISMSDATLVSGMAPASSDSTADSVMTDTMTVSSSANPTAASSSSVSEQTSSSTAAADSPDSMLERSLLKPLTNLDPNAKKVLLHCLQSDSVPSEIPKNISRLVTNLKSLPSHLKVKVFDILQP